MFNVIFTLSEHFFQKQSPMFSINRTEKSVVLYNTVWIPFPGNGYISNQMFDGHYLSLYVCAQHERLVSPRGLHGAWLEPGLVLSAAICRGVVCCHWTAFVRHGSQMRGPNMQRYLVCLPLYKAVNSALEEIINFKKIHICYKRFSVLIYQHSLT